MEGTKLRWCISTVRWVLGFIEGTVSSYTKSKMRGKVRTALG